MSSPMQQFEIQNLSPTLFHIAGQPVAFTNAALGMVLAAVIASVFILVSMRPRAVVPGRWQMFCELVYNFVADIVFSGAGEKARIFVPLVFTLFLFILTCNLLGLVPSAFTATAQLVINFGLALTVIVSLIVTGIRKHGLHFFKIFVPSGLPWWLAPFVVIIEVVSFFIRPCSLSIRLFVNMMAGHVMLKVIAGMSVMAATFGGAMAGVVVFPIVLNAAILIFELLVAFLQAYIFVTLSSVYFRDALEMH